MVTPTARVLKRFYFIERQTILIQAGWLPGLEHWESKLLLPEIMWETSVLARELRNRVLELRFPERRITVDDEGPLLELVRRCGHSPNGIGVVLALGAVIKPWLLEAYRSYRLVADAIDDGPTQFFLRHGIADLESQIARLQTIAAAGLRAFPAQAEAAQAWCAAVKATFAALSPDLLLAENPPAPTIPAELLALERPFTIARKAARDPRFRVMEFAWPDRHSPGNPGEGPQLQARQAVHHVNEVWAAEMAAACLYDLAPDAPHEFLDDAARWCYDEIRHCRMGYERLKAWGLKDDEIPLDAFSYDAGSDADSLVRLGIIFYFEATYIHTKSERKEIFGAMGDRLSSHDMDFDWADELIHTHYGKRWLGHFLESAGAGRSVAMIKEEARQAVLRLQSQATAGAKAAAAEAARRVVARVSLAVGGAPPVR